MTLRLQLDHITALIPVLAVTACANADLGVADTGAGADAAVVGSADADDGVDASSALLDAPDILDASIPEPDSATATTADAGPTDGCVPGWTNVLSNAGFESGRTVWSEDLGGGTQPIIRQQGGGLPFAAFGGTWAALMLGYNNASLALSQSVTVPAGALALRVTGFKCWVTDETVGTGDRITIELRSGAGALLQTLAAISNADAGAVCSWTAFEYSANASHAGQTLQFVIAGSSNSANATSFAFDSLTVGALMCP